MVVPVDLELTDDDMYSDGTIIQFEDGTQLLQRDIEQHTSSGNDNYREIVSGETLDSIAYNEYYNSKLWYKIADANLIFNPFDLTPGLGIIIPEVIINQS